MCHVPVPTPHREHNHDILQAGNKKNESKLHVYAFLTSVYNPAGTDLRMLCETRAKIHSLHGILH